MSDEFDFEGFDTPYDAAGSEPAPQAPAGQTELQQTQTPEAPAINPEEYRAMQARLEGLERWKQDAVRVFIGDTGQQPQFNRDEYLSQFVSDPRQVVRQEARDEAQQIVMDTLNAQQMLQEYRQKYPELAPFEAEIFANAKALHQYSQQTGQPLQERQAIDKAIEDYKTRLSAYQQHGQQQAAGQQVRYMAMNPGTGQTPPPSNQKPNFWGMSREEFGQVRANRGGWNPNIHE